jgi:hypothetical protein
MGKKSKAKKSNPFENLQQESRVARVAAEQRSKENLEQRKKLVQDLQAQARGEGPSLASAQLKAASDRSLAQQLGAAAAARGGNVAAIQRGLQQSQDLSRRELAQDSAQARIQEQLNAQNQLGNLLESEQGRSDQLSSGYLGQMYDASRIDAEVNAQRKKNEADKIGSIAGGLTGIANLAGGASKLFSDEKTKKAPDSGKKYKGLYEGAQDINRDPIVRGISSFFGSKEDDKKVKSDVKSKKNIEYSDEQTKKFLDAIRPVSYEYKNEYKRKENDNGEQLGILAQDLEKAGEAGKRMVIEDENGTKMVDFGKGFGTILAAQAHLNNRLKEIESKYKKNKKE